MWWWWWWRSISAIALFSFFPFSLFFFILHPYYVYFNIESSELLVGFSRSAHGLFFPLLYFIFFFFYSVRFFAFLSLLSLISVSAPPYI